jgi:ABC-type spermidine/putrescine transport system permease subunit I
VGRRPVYGTSVVLLSEYLSDLGEASLWNYGVAMAIVLMMVVLAFGLLYVAVVAEERQMQEATKPRKR